MLHELLLALSGVSGDLFVPYPPEPEKPVLFKIPPDFPFLHEAERTSLERLAVLGFHYRCINKFLSACLGRRSESESSRNVLQGSFVHALCNAINGVLCDYQKLVLESEQKILNNEDNMGGVVPISHFTSVFAEYHIILPQLCALVNEIEANPEKYLGCRILNLLVEKCNTGVPQLREVMLKLVHACHGVMYQHITSWMVYGHLQDTFGEFFIKDQTPQLQQEHAQTLEDSYNKTRWHQRFTLDETLLPNHIPRNIAESILFVGKAIATVKNARRPNQGKSVMMPRSLSLLHLQYLLELSSKDTFHHAELKSVVTTIRTNVAEWLWQAVLTGDKVIECLMGFRNYFLLGQGDFALSLIEEFEKLAASRLKAKRATTIREQGLNSLFVRASVGTLAENDLVLEKFRFKLVNSDENSSLPLNVFDDVVIGVPLRLEYEITWPLNLFVTTEDLSKYGDLFSFLISLRRTQHRLHKAWAHLSTVQKCTSDVSQDKKGKSLIWKARASMLFFIDCLWGHVQV